MYQKLLLVLTTLLSICSCGSYSYSTEAPKATKAPKAVYKQIDVEDVEHAKSIIDINKKTRMQTINSGAERKGRFEPLMLKLIAFNDYGHELKLSDVKPFRKELPHISSIFTNEEKNEFVRISTEDHISIEKLYNEAKKGEGNAIAVKELKARNTELQKQIDSGYTDMLIKLSSSFLGVGGFMLVLSVFPFIALYAGKVRAMGAILLATGGAILTIGTFVESVRETLDKHGNWLFLLLAVPSIIFLVILGGAWTKNKVEDMDDEVSV